MPRNTGADTDITLLDDASLEQLMVNIVRRHPGGITAEAFCAEMRRLGAPEAFRPDLIGVLPSEVLCFNPEAGFSAPH